MQFPVFYYFQSEKLENSTKPQLEITQISLGTFFFMIFVKTNKEGIKTWTTLSGWSGHETLNFIIKAYVSLIFDTQFNITNVGNVL